MSKLFKSLLSVFLAVFMVASLAIIPSSAATPKLSKTSVTVTKGYQTTLSVSNASGTVTWSTGDKSIATVSSKGKVVGKGPGTTYIYAKTGGTTLKCKVKVVASKITSNKSSVTLDKIGDTATVTFTVKGSHSGIKVGSTNSSVAKAAWASSSWDGDNVTVKITAKGEGTARIKVYNQNYSSSCYKYVDVTVKDTSVKDNVIMPYTKDVKIKAGESYNLQVYAQNQTNLLCSVMNNNVAAVTSGTASGNYRNFSIKGVTAGTTTIRFYDRYSAKSYVDVSVTVAAADVKYYEFYTTSPATKLISTDQILQIKPTSSTVYYMLVPANYDSAYVNTLTAQKFNVYDYYKVYTTIPSRKAATDTYQQFYNSNVNYTYGYRYVLLPANYDEVQYNTTVAKYNNKYEYYTIYSEIPVRQNNWDRVEQWQVTDAATGRLITRYLLAPYNGYDQNKVDEIKNKDQNANMTYQRFTIYTTQPTVNNASDEVIWFASGGTWKFMIVPKNATVTDYVKANDAILKDTGIYEYNVLYSTMPVNAAATDERLAQGRIGSSYVYVLYKPDSLTPVANQDANAVNTAMKTYADGTR